MLKIAEFIVKQRKIIYIVFLVVCVLCGIGMTKVNVEYSITAYLPQDTDTRKAIDIMDEEFTTYGTTQVLVRNVGYENAAALRDDIVGVDGVKSLEFENTRDYYSQSCALFYITFEGDEDDPRSVAAYDTVSEMLAPYDVMIASKLVDTYADELRSDINFVLILALIVIVLVLSFTSKSFAEVPVFLIVFAVSALLNMGTNFWLGTISFISNSVCVILQLALAIDYAIILCHRFTEEKEKNGGDAFGAVSQALSKAIPEILGSSLTTIAGLMALTTMSLGLGADMGIVLAKSIVCSMLTVFLLMPGLLLFFSKAMNKTRHRNFVPRISAVGKFDVKCRFVIPVVFLALAVTCCILSFQTDYVYSANSIDTSRPSEAQLANAEIRRIFGHKNRFVVLASQGDYDEQKAILDMVESEDMISSATGIANVKLTSNNITYCLTDRMNYKDFALFLGADDNTASSIYGAYAYFSRADSKDGMTELAVFEANKDIYKVSVLDLCDCAFDNDDFIYAYLYDTDALDTYVDMRDTIRDAEAQLVGEHYSRMLFNIDGEVESADTFALIEKLQAAVKSKCPGAIFAGDSMSSYDLDASFSGDNLKVSLLTVAFVFVILMFTFRSWGVPLPLTLTIQSAIFINFSYYALAGVNLFFFIYLIVSSIQMGATIDYAIVVTNRYEELKKTTDKKTAIIEAINGSFPTIVTSGTIMAVAGFLIGGLVSDPLISTLGMCLGRGVIISILSVMFVLPTLLYIFDKPLSLTTFKERENPLAKDKLRARRDKRRIKLIKELERLDEEARNDEEK